MKILFAFTGADTAPLPANLRIVDTGGFPDGGPCGELVGPLVMNDIADPWSGHASLQITLYRPADTAVGGIQADDAVSLTSPERSYGDCIDMKRKLMLPPGLTHIVINIDPMQTTQGNRDFDFSQIRSLTLDLGGAPASPVYIRNLRLCGEHDTVGPPAVPVPGETVTYLQHQDITCYTYELEKVEPPGDVRRLTDQLRSEMRRLSDLLRIARLGGKQTLYAEAAMTAAEIALDVRARFPWTNHPERRREDLAAALERIRAHARSLDAYVRGIVHEDDEDDSNLPIPAVPDMPDLSSLRISGNAFVDADGHPVLLYAMNYHHEGPLLRFFAPDNHRVESYAVGGGSRYDIDWSPVYRAFHQHANARRVGYRGWCGHLIKDQWAMGGRKENVLICLESDAIRDAVKAYNRQHQHEWRHNPNLLYNILAYELMYICYCDKSVRMYRQWLKEKYGTIAVLNAAWGEAFPAFDDIVPPHAPDGAPPPETNRAAWFDWTSWNTRRFTDILLWAKANIRELDPDVPICAGGTSSMVSANNGNTGIDEELIINELDDVILHEGADLLTLDLLRALSDSPKPIVDPEHGAGAYGILQSFLHGKSAVAKFTWPKQPSRQFPHTTLRTPMQGLTPIPEVEEHLRIALDMRRLGREIACFWDLKPEVAVHYSKTCILQVPFGLLRARATPYLQTLRQSYDGARKLDAPVTFISDRQIRSGRASHYKILVLPAVKYAPDGIVDALDTYLKHGGAVVLLPESLAADEYARPQGYLDRWGIRVDAVSVPQILDLGPAEQGYDQSFSQQVRFGEGRSLRADRLSGGLFPDGAVVETAGIFQEISVENGEVLAAAGGLPLLVRKTVGRGVLYYFAGAPTPETYRGFMDRIMEQAGVTRPFAVTGPDGARLPDVEARLARTKYHDLVYLVNESDAPVEFRIRTDRPAVKIRELRSLKYWKKPEGVLPPRQTFLFKFMADPVAIGRAAEEPAYPYAGGP